MKLPGHFPFGFTGVFLSQQQPNLENAHGAFFGGAAARPNNCKVNYKLELQSILFIKISYL